MAHVKVSACTFRVSCRGYTTIVDSQGMHVISKDHQPVMAAQGLLSRLTHTTRETNPVLKLQQYAVLQKKERL